MIKKTLAAIALIAASSFATWDKFPVLDQGNGQAKVGFEYDILGDLSIAGVGAGARYSVIQNLEIALNFGYVLWTDYDGEDMEIDGLTNPEIGVRYFLPMGLGFFLESSLPFGNEDVDYTGFGFHFGAQYSTAFSDMIVFGSELGLALYTEDDDKATHGTELNAGIEVDFKLGMVTPFVGLDIIYMLTDSEWDGYSDDDGGNMGIAPCVGLLFAFNDMISADIKGTLGTGDYFSEDDNLIILAINGYVNF
ncbi:MAG: transporter [Fibrobacteraceae bacterium]